MAKMFSKFPYDRNRLYNMDEAIDAGQEVSLLKERSQQRLKAETSTPLGEHRRKNGKTLISELLASVAHPQLERSAKPSNIQIERERDDEDQEASDKKYAEQLQSAGRSRPIRTTRQTQRYLSPSPPQRPPVVKFSKVHGIHPEWTHPVVYPLAGKKRTTVIFSDLERLDEDEMLNDNLIEFYIRWLTEHSPGSKRQVYFFGTHFYTALTTGGKRGFNYEAVQRWTAKDDIFSYDFVVVPVNES
jgi:Ulp1 family protease